MCICMLYIYIDIYDIHTCIYIVRIYCNNTILPHLARRVVTVIVTITSIMFIIIIIIIIITIIIIISSISVSILFCYLNHYY